MPLTHTLTRGWTSSQGGTIAKSITTPSSGAETALDESIAATTTDELVAFVMDVSQLKSIYIVSDQDLLLQLNDGTTPSNTITLVANKPFTWITGDNALRDTAGALITTDITAIYATNAGASAALLQLRASYDPTV